VDKVNNYGKATLRSTQHIFGFQKWESFES